MKIISDRAEAANIADPELRHLIQKTIRDLSEDYPYDADELGYFLIVEPGDTLATINAKIGFDILANRWTGKRFDQPGYTQSFEILDEHAGYFEMVFVISDSGYGVEVFVPKPASTTGKQGSTASTAGGNAVDADLLAMCARYATVAGPALATPVRLPKKQVSTVTACHLPPATTATHSGYALVVLVISKERPAGDLI